MNKIVRGIAAGLAILSGDVVLAQTPTAPPAEARPAATSQQMLRAWLEQQFLLIGQSCSQQIRIRRDRNMIPHDVLTWGPVSGRLDSTFTVHNGTSLNGLFSRVYRDNNGSWAPVGQEIGIVWVTDVPPILYDQSAHAQRRHNCATMLSADARTELNLGVAEIRAALTANASTETTLTAFVYAGRVISPIAASMNLVPHATRTPNGIAPFGVLMSLWNWYHINRDMIGGGASGNLRIINELQGVATYLVSGLTNRGYLEGSASASGSYLVFSASANVAGRVERATTGTHHDFSVALYPIPAEAYTTLLGPAEIARRAALRADFRPAEAPAPVETADPFRYSTDLYDLPELLCDPTLWSLRPATGTGQGIAALSGLDVRPDTANGIRVCRFSVRVIPPATTQSYVEVPLSVGWAIAPSGQNPTAVELTLAPRDPVRIPDYRASITIARGEGPPAVTVPATGPATVQLTYWLHETQGRRASGIVPASAQLNLSCDGGESRSVILRGDAAGWVRAADGSAKVVVGADLSQDLQAVVQTGTVSQCRLTGMIEFSVEGSTNRVRAPLSALAFRATRDAGLEPTMTFSRSVQ